MSDANQAKANKTTAGATGPRKLNQQIAYQAMFSAQQNPSFGADLYGLLFKHKLIDALHTLVSQGAMAVLFQATFEEEQAKLLEGELQAIQQRAMMEMFQKQFSGNKTEGAQPNQFGGMFGMNPMMGGFNPMMMGGMMGGDPSGGGFNPMMMGGMPGMMGGFNPMMMGGMNFGVPTAPGSGS